MTLDELKAAFEQFGDSEFNKHDRLSETISTRPDVNAFRLLDRLVPGRRDIVSAAEHDQIWLDVDLAELAAACTEQNIKDLIRCGVWLDKDTDSLSMFV